MTRNIITKEDIKPLEQGPIHFGEVPVETPVAPRKPATADTYFDRLSKYVPVEIIGAYLIVEGLVRGLLKDQTLSWGLLVLLLLGAVGSWSFARQVLGVKRPVQLAMTTFAFFVWVFATGGWFSTLQFWAPGWGTIAVVVFGVMVQIVKIGPLPSNTKT
jgi:hypothetical protein